MSYSFNAVEMDQRSPLPLNLLLDRSRWMFSRLGKSLGMRGGTVEAKLARRCASHGDPSTLTFIGRRGDTAAFYDTLQGLNDTG